MRRSMLFIPGNTPNLLINSPYLGADAVIYDLEDAVSPAEKDSARILVRNTLRSVDLGGRETIVRINAIDTEYWKKDIDAVAPQRPSILMVPKSSRAEDIQAVDDYVTRVEERLGAPQHAIRLMPLIETALGVENAFSIAAASPRVAALFLGAEDLTADLRCQRTKEGGEIQYARGRLVCGARAAGIEAYDTPFTDVQDLEGLAKDAAYAKSLGFTGKACISPAHVTTVNRVFSPTQADIDYAKDVFAAIAEAKRQGKGAISLRGKMIDAPIVQRARMVLEAASEIEGVDYLA